MAVARDENLCMFAEPPAPWSVNLHNRENFYTTRFARLRYLPAPVGCSVGLPYRGRLRWSVSLRVVVNVTRAMSPEAPTVTIAFTRKSR